MMPILFAAIADTAAILHAIAEYIRACIADGDYVNDWLTHVPPMMRGALQSLGQDIAYLWGYCRDSDMRLSWMHPAADAMRAMREYILALLALLP